MSQDVRTLDLEEYQARSLPESDLSEELARILHGSFREQIVIEPPSFLNEYAWRLTSQGWVGYIPVADDLHLRLLPKVPVGNLFRMLEYAYRHEFRVLEGMADARSIAEVYERLAVVLAKRVIDRIRRGLYRSYVAESDELPYLRGRFDAVAHLRNPIRATLPCDYEEHTSDLADNQILLWTLTRILESGACTEKSLALIRQARRVLLGWAELRPFSPRDCIGRLYNRLNQDYEPMHALCRFFLEHTGPTYQSGDHRMLPILVNMETLFEQFVVAWLEQHMPERYRVRAQENVEFGVGHTLKIRIDITIEDALTGRACYVLDTKYKKPDKPAADDFEQVVAYASAKDATRAALIYPTEIEKPVRGAWGSGIEFDTLVFALDEDLEEAGRRMMGKLVADMEQHSAREGQI